MNILLVGGKSHFLQLLIEKLNKEGHRIFILTDEPKSWSSDPQSLRDLSFLV